MSPESQKQHASTRRAFLRGAGVVIALPWLESYAPTRAIAAAHVGKAPVRLACLFMPNGVWGPTWTPKTVGLDYDLPETLAPLAKVRDQTLVLTNLRNRNAREGEGHYVKTTSLLSGAKVRRTGGRDIRCGTTVDQVAARHIGHLTPLPSLELGTTPPRKQVDMGYSTLYGAHISWKTPTRPLAKEIHPDRVFRRLFRTSRMGVTRTDRSVLDLILAESRSLDKRLSKADRAKVDEYLESVRALEKRIAMLSMNRGGGSVVDDAADRLEREGQHLSYSDRVELMLDLIVLAFRTDTTRLSTFMFENSVSGRNFSFLDGVNGGHHHYSHHEDKPEKIEPYKIIGRWHVAQVARMLEKMRAVKEEDGSTLLDNSMVFFASGIRDGNRHEPKNLPVLLAGGGGGRLKTGRHVKCLPNTRLCELHIAALHGLGVPVKTFGDADRPLSDLLV